jgi:hypothetical protein
LKMLGSTPGLGSRAVHIVAAGPWAEGREKIAVAKIGGWGYTELGPGCCVSFTCACWSAFGVHARSARMQMAS